MFNFLYNSICDYLVLELAYDPLDVVFLMDVVCLLHAWADVLAVVVANELHVLVCA